MPANLTNVPLYGLYGEPFQTNEPGFVHIESIADRSSNLGWVINAHRHSKLFQVLYIHNGQVEVFLENETHKISGTWIVSIPAGVIHGFQFQPESEGFVLSIENSVLAVSPEDNKEDNSNKLNFTPQLIECSEENEHIKQFLHHIALIRQEFQHYYVKRREALAWLSRIALLSLNRYIWQKQFRNIAGSENSELLSRFWLLLETHYREHWSVPRYADKMNMSTSSLNRFCHQYIGDSPKAIIQDRVLGEAKRRLVYTRQSIDEIAYALGFKDQAYFSRFFKTREGITPGNYRKHTD